MPATIAGLAADPAPLTRRLVVGGEPFVLRALLPSDTAAMMALLANLSDTSRGFWHGDVDAADQAAEWAEAIGRYDKLRLVAHREDARGRLDGMVDLSFCVPDFAELARYAGYGITLDPLRTARFGPCVSDARRGSGLAAAMLPPTWDAVRLLGCDRVSCCTGVCTRRTCARNASTGGTGSSTRARSTAARAST